MNVKLVGSNKCKAGDTILHQNESVQLKHGDVLELLEKQYSYVIEFNPSPSSSNSVLKETVDSEMVGRQTTLNDFLGKRKPQDSADGSKELKKPKLEHTWQEIEGGKLIVFTTDGVQSKSKVCDSIKFLRVLPEMLTDLLKKLEKTLLKLYCLNDPSNLRLLRLIWMEQL